MASSAPASHSIGTITQKTYAARHQLIGTKVPYLADVSGVLAGP